MLVVRITEDLRTAQKAADSLRVGTLRLLIAQFQNRAIEKRGGGDDMPLTDAETLQVLQREAKKRREAIEVFTKGGRDDLANKEKAELVLIEQYIPAMMSRDEIRAVVEAARKKGPADFPTLMKEVMKRLQGQADGKTVSEVIREALG